ncbi:MAG: response regulator [Desulfobacterales bacterium]|nr:MAG: response regulator [Desulfobacterales bacterium]
MAPNRILIVEDSPTAMRQITEILHNQGYDLIRAVDGEEALEKALQEKPHIILLDVILPKKNGFQVCRQLKTTPDTKDIKILMLTSKSQDSDCYWGLKQGADGYLTKPFEDVELLDNIAQLL